MKTRAGEEGSNVGGTPTFLVLDIDGTEYVYTREISVLVRVMERYRSIMSDVVRMHGGRLIEDLCFSGRHYSAYDRPSQAILAAVDINRTVENDPELRTIPIHVRIAICTGEHDPDLSWARSPALLRADALEKKIHGEQIVVTLATQDLVRDLLPADYGFIDLGTVQLVAGMRGERVFQLTHPDLREEFPPIDETEEPGHTIPPRLTFFLGREQEIEEVQEGLDLSRLLTLYGPGGVGKTSLACRVALGVVEDYERGVRYVDYTLAPKGSRAVDAIAETFRLRPRPKITVEQAVFAYFASRQILLVLDNCDPVVDDLREFAERFLKACPRVQLLVTCQNQLQAQGESAYKVEPLKLPPESLTSVEEIAEYDAVALFIDRVRAQNQAFTLTKTNAPAVVQICRRLDGLPLAIELAAPLVTMMSLEEILKGLDDRFKLLETGRSGRGQTGAQALLQMIRLSYEKLSAAERVVFRRLSVFAGRWTAESAIAVCADDQVDAEVVRLAIDTLLVNSLIERTGGSVEGTYRFLETIREFARVQLAEAGELNQMRDRHCLWCLALVEHAASNLSNENQAFALQVLERNRENLLVALDWAARPGLAQEIGNQFIFYCYPLWVRKSWLAEGRSFVERILELVHKSDSQELARAYNTLGVLTTFMGDLDTARGQLLNALRIYERLGYERGIASVYTNLAINSVYGRDYNTAVLEYEESISRWRSLNEGGGYYAALGSYAEVLVLVGRLDEAQEVLDEADRLAREFKDLFAQGAFVYTRGELALARGDSDAAEDCFRENIIRSRSIGNLFSIANSLRMIAFIALRQMSYQRAAMLLGAEKRCRDDVAATLPQWQAQELNEAYSELKGTLGFAKFDDIFDVGYTMRLSEMVDLSLNEGNLPQ